MDEGDGVVAEERVVSAGELEVVADVAGGLLAGHAGLAQPTAMRWPRAARMPSLISHGLADEQAGQRGCAVESPLTAGGSAHTSTPLIRTWPASGRSRPVIMDRDMVFPAPFADKTGEGTTAISQSIPATASFVPKLLRSPRTAMAGSPSLPPRKRVSCRSDRQQDL